MQWNMILLSLISTSFIGIKSNFIFHLFFSSYINLKVPVLILNITGNFNGCYQS